MTGERSVLEAIPESVRRQMDVYEHQMKSVAPEKRRRLPFPEDVPLKVASGLWIQQHLIKLIKPSAYMDFAEQHQRLTQTLGGLPTFEKAAMGETTTGTGPELVPTIVQAEILRLTADNSVLRPLVRHVPMTSNQHAFPTRASALSAFIVPEAGTITDSIPATPFSQSMLKAKMFGAFATVSLQLLQDNVVALVDWLATEFAEQFGRKEDEQGLEGTSDTSTSFVGVTAASGVNSVSSGANGDGIIWQLLVQTIFKAGEISSLRNAAFFMHPSAMGAILQGRAAAVSANDQSGGVIFTASQPLSAEWAPRILGFPVFTTSVIANNRTIGTGSNRTQIYFGPPQSIIFGDLFDLQIDLNPWAKFQSAQIDIRGVKRTGILIGVPSAWTQYQRVDAALPMK